MPIEQVFEKKEEAPEWLQSHLVEADGKFVFKGETAAEVENLKKTTKKERDARTKFEGELKKFERFKPLADADDDEWSQFLEGWNKRGEKPPPPDKSQEELQAKLHAKEIKKRDDELAKIKTEHDKAQNELREFRLWTPLRDIAINAGLFPEDWELARLELASQGRFGFDDDGKIVVIEDGGPSSVTPERFFKEVYSDLRKKFYKASGAGGGGAVTGTKNGDSSKTIKQSAFNDLNPVEKMEKMKAGFKIVE